LWSGIIIITKNINHKLKYANTWIYTTTNDTLTITCQREQEPYILKIRNQGILTLKQDCRAYADDIVLNPTREVKSKYNTNFIPKISEGSLNLKFSKLITNVEIPIPKYKQRNDLIKLDNVHELAHSLDDIQLMVDNELDRQTGHDNQDHHYLIYTIIGLLLFSLFLILVLYVMYRCNINLKRTYYDTKFKPVKQPNVKNRAFYTNKQNYRSNFYSSKLKCQIKSEPLEHTIYKNL